MKLTGYSGPTDGRSNPNMKAQAWLKPAAAALLAAYARVEVNGEENIPQDGRSVYCPTHPTAADPIGVLCTMPGDVRSMANKDFFYGPAGDAMTAMGAFPVQRENPDSSVFRHSVEVVKNPATKLLIFPEGDCSALPYRVKPLKTGAARIAIAGNADHIVPMSVHYAPDVKPRWGERVAGFAAAAALTAAGVATAGGGGIASLVVGMAAGATAGSLLGRQVAHHTIKNHNTWNITPNLFGRLAGALVGGIAGASVAYATGGSTALAAMGGASALGWSHILSSRPVCHIDYLQPIPVAPYAAMADSKAAATDLTEQLHIALAKAKATRSGVAYDPALPHVRHGKGVNDAPPLPSEIVPTAK